MAAHQDVQLETASSPAIDILEAESQWERAAEAARTIHEQCYRIAGIVVCLQFLDRVLLSRLTRALDHLPRSFSAEASLTIRVYEASPGSPSWAQAHTEIRPGSHPRYLVKSSDLLALFQPVDGALSILDPARGRGYFTMVDKARLSAGELAAPFRFLLGSWLSRHNLSLIHAAALGTPSGGVLLVGRGGSGKSTAALACLGSELGYSADDAVLVSSGPRPMVYSLFNSGKLRLENLARFPHLAAPIPICETPVEDKSVYFVQEHHPQQVVLQFPLRAILVTRHTGCRHTALQPASRAEALKALAPSTIFQLPGSGQAALDLAKDLVERAPVFVLETGSDLATIPASLMALLRRFSADTV